MADYSVDSKSMTSKVLSLIVAIVVFACVLVPVLDTVQNGNSGGGSGDTGDTTPSTLMNDGIPYASADTETHTISVQLVDGNFIIKTDGNIIDTGLTYTPYDESNPVYDSRVLVIGKIPREPVEDMAIILANAGYIIGYSAYNEPMNIADVTDGVEYTLSIDGTNLTYTLPEENNAEDSVIVDYFISESGEYVMTASAKIFQNTKIVVAYMDNEEFDFTENGETTSMPPRFFIGSGYLPTINVSIKVTDFDGIMSFIPNVTQESGYYTLNSIDCVIDATFGSSVQQGETEITQVLVPKTVIHSDEKVTYTNHGDMYFAKADADSVQHTISITLGKYDDMTLIVDGQTLSDFAQSKVSVFAYGSVFLCKIWMEEDDEHDMNYKLVWIDADNNITLIKPTSSTSTDLGYIESETYQFTIQNSKLSWTDESDQTRETPIDIYISSTGEYVLATDPNYTPLVGKNTDIYVYFRYADISNMPELPPNSDLYHNVTVVGGFNTSVLTSDSVEVDSILFETESTNLHTVVHPLISDLSVNPNMMTVDATLIYKNISYPNYELNPIRTFIIPVNVTFGDDADGGSGSGSGSSGNSGITNTLIGLIPIFVVLGLLMFAVTKLGLLDIAKSRLE